MLNNATFTHNLFIYGSDNRILLQNSHTWKFGLKPIFLSNPCCVNKTLGKRRLLLVWGNHSAHVIFVWYMVLVTHKDGDMSHVSSGGFRYSNCFPPELLPSVLWSARGSNVRDCQSQTVNVWTYLMLIHYPILWSVMRNWSSAEYIAYLFFEYFYF